MNWEAESGLALNGVVRAAEMFSTLPDNSSVVQKESLRDLVSETDLRIETFLKLHLASSPYPVLGEEMGWSVEIEKKSPLLYWALDPIDGTVNYLNGIPFYGTSVGLVKEHHDEISFLIGAVVLPLLKEVFFTHGDAQSFLNGTPLIIKDQILEQSLIIAAFPSKTTDTSLQSKQFHFLGEINNTTRGVLRIGSAAAGICYVAAGKANLAYSFRAKIWDVAGALAIAKAAKASLWTRKIRDTNELQYIVGAPAAVNSFKNLAMSEGLI